MKFSADTARDDGPLASRKSSFTRSRRTPTACSEAFVFSSPAGSDCRAASASSTWPASARACGSTSGAAGEGAGDGADAAAPARKMSSPKSLEYSAGSCPPSDRLQYAGPGALENLLDGEPRREQVFEKFLGIERHSRRPRRMPLGLRRSQRR